MILVTAQQMQRADSRTINDFGLPGFALMENAARGAVDILCEVYGGLPAKVAAFCGKGNNGGDGLAMLRILAGRGADCTAYLLADKSGLSGDAAANLKIALNYGIQLREITNQAALEQWAAEAAEHDFIIDAVLGVGFKGQVKGLYLEAITLMNNLGLPILAVDVPSGLAADEGLPQPEAVRAVATATFGLPKQGLYLDAGQYAGQVRLVDIGLPRQVTDEIVPAMFLADEAEVSSLLPARPADGHKGRFGHVLIVGGSPGLSGAPCLAALGSQRAGAGLVTVAIAHQLNNILEIKLTAAMTLPLAQTAHGVLSLEAYAEIAELAARCQAVVLGPGLGRDEETISLVKKLVLNLECPLVLDADGLYAYMGQAELLTQRVQPLVITPHPGEAARLLGLTIAQVQANRPAAARRLAAQAGCVAILKGARTLTALPGGQVWLNPTGNTLLASGGSGDILAGLVGGLLAQDPDPGKAAVLAAYVHGRAADMAREDFGLRGLAAEELADYLPGAFAELEL